MPIKGRFFPTQVKQERVFLLIRKHWFVYVIFGLLFILMIVPVVAVLIYWSLNYQTISTLNGNIIIAGTSAYLLFLLGVQLFGFVDYYLDVDIVTDRRLVDIDQNGLFKRKISELYLHQVQDVEAKVEGIAGTLFHFGDVYIQTAGERENFIFRSIPHPYTVAKQIVNLHEQQYQQELMVRTGKQEGRTGESLSFRELESQAKDILRSQSFPKRIVNPGIFPALGIDNNDFDEDRGLGGEMGNDFSRDNEIKLTDSSLVSHLQPETGQDEIDLKTTRKKAIKKPGRTKRKAKKKQLKSERLSEEGELKEGREVDLRD